MAKYKILPQVEGARSEPRTLWTSATCPGLETGESRGPHGLMALDRYTHPDEPYGRIAFVVGGREYDYVIEPCPTRVGLVRMARKLLRAALKEKNGG